VAEPGGGLLRHRKILHVGMTPSSPDMYKSLDIIWLLEAETKRLRKLPATCAALRRYFSHRNAPKS
jgi:hypothetical protein